MWMKVRSLQKDLARSDTLGLIRYFVRRSYRHQRFGANFANADHLAWVKRSSTEHKTQPAAWSTANPCPAALPVSLFMSCLPFCGLGGGGGTQRLVHGAPKMDVNAHTGTARASEARCKCVSHPDVRELHLATVDTALITILQPRTFPFLPEKFSLRLCTHSSSC